MMSIRLHLTIFLIYILINMLSNSISILKKMTNHLLADEVIMGPETTFTNRKIAAYRNFLPKDRFTYGA